ncbi:MAG: toxin-antitoxin system YwqK family antitoxin [Saprospiraceae bacterium]|nr:toxin-antitoxin system YwqK family antitoxin [Saprospiraceae bacterium]
MQITRLSLLALFGFLALFISFCKNNPVETVESRDKEGQLERWQRRKQDFAKEGLYQRFSANGQLLEEARYTNDTLDGERKFYFPNGKTEAVERFRRGQYHGKYQRFYESGQLYVEQEFVDGAMQGLSIVYYPNGAIKEKVTIRNNTEDGPFWEYWENGNLKAEGIYVVFEDEPLEHGELKEYNESGELIRIAQCDKGVCLTTWKK